MQLLRSLTFNLLIYGAMAVYGLVFFIPTLFSRNWAFAACHAWCRFTVRMARWILGVHVDIRGTPPDGSVLVAAKHQSFLDIILIFHSMPRGKFIMKRELMFMPIIGQYGLRLGCIPVNRGKRGAAIKKMKEDVARGQAEPGQLIIFSQGTRVKPGDKRPYKVGTGVLYEQLGQTCVPVATNAGCFWPRRGVKKWPGLAVVEFLEPIEAGRPVEEFMADLETRVEAASDRLLDEAVAAAGSRGHIGPVVGK